MEPIPEVEDVDPEVDDPAVHDAVAEEDIVVVEELLIITAPEDVLGRDKSNSPVSASNPLSSHSCSRLTLSSPIFRIKINKSIIIMDRGNIRSTSEYTGCI